MNPIYSMSSQINEANTNLKTTISTLSSPVQNSQVHTIPVQNIPVQNIPFQHISVQNTLVQNTPVQNSTVNLSTVNIASETYRILGVVTVFPNQKKPPIFQNLKQYQAGDKRLEYSSKETYHPVEQADGPPRIKKFVTNYGPSVEPRPANTTSLRGDVVPYYTTTVNSQPIVVSTLNSSIEKDECVVNKNHSNISKEQTSTCLSNETASSESTLRSFVESGSSPMNVLHQSNIPSSESDVISNYKKRVLYNSTDEILQNNSTEVVQDTHGNPLDELNSFIQSSAKIVDSLFKYFVMSEDDEKELLNKGYEMDLSPSTLIQEAKDAQRERKEQSEE